MALIFVISRLWATIVIGLAAAGPAWWIFGSDRLTDGFLAACILVIDTAIGVRAWQARRESMRIQLQRRVGVTGFLFADPEAARRFAASNAS